MNNSSSSIKQPKVHIDETKRNAVKTSFSRHGFKKTSNYEPTVSTHAALSR